MQDFIKIGGPIISSPLNENFRRLTNAVSMANTNLIFSQEDGIVNSITEMYNIQSPLDGQVCYVVASGELYRYSVGKEDWFKIADFGNTFRQGFLNSGVVMMEGPIEFISTDHSEFKIPQALIYFKNKDGDGLNLKGMYRFWETNFTNTLLPGVYSIYAMIDETLETPTVYRVFDGLPDHDEVNKVYIGSFLIGHDGVILSDFLFTIPDMAFTADRSIFYLDGGRAQGCNLRGAGGATVNRDSGYYYDEGINCPYGNIPEEYPETTDNGADFNIKHFDGETPVEKLYYMIPAVSTLTKPVTVTSGLIINKYYNRNTNQLENVAPGQFTIQQHFMTPIGQDVILYGDTVYNSLEDAVAHINDTFSNDLDFPRVEATRIVVGNFNNFDTLNSNMVVFYTMGRLSQVGTISPSFADNEFRLYSSRLSDTTPAMSRFSLDLLADEDYDVSLHGIFDLSVLPYNKTRKLFSLDSKYITDETSIPMQQTVSGTRVNQRTGNGGYALADVEDVEDAISRISDLEAEVWKTTTDITPMPERGIRERLYVGENSIAALLDTTAAHAGRLLNLEQSKVNKSTTINGITLGDSTNINEAKTIVLTTDNINEGSNNLYYTENRVSANTDVVAAAVHITRKGSGVESNVNPHAMSTDDITILSNSTHKFVTDSQLSKINNLPANTITAVNDLQNNKIEDIPIYTLGGSKTSPTGVETLLGNFKTLKIYSDGIDFDTDTSNKVLTLNIRGQIYESTWMARAHYATLEALSPVQLDGYVDKSVASLSADNINGMSSAGNDKYYGTNSNGNVGIYNLPVYVTTVNQSSFGPMDQIIFTPVTGSVNETHLTTTLADKINNNYHTIYDGGVVSSTEINTIDFGDNMTVTVNGHKATVNAVGASGTPITQFANLSDVDVTYTGNAGKMLVVNANEDGVELANSPALSNYMLKSVYVDPTDTTRVKGALAAVNAEVAANSLKLMNKTVDDTLTTDAVLWTAAKIISNTSSQIASEGVQVYFGTTTPSSSLGKNGDIYILTD